MPLWYPWDIPKRHRKWVNWNTQDTLKLFHWSGLLSGKPLWKRMSWLQEKKWTNEKADLRVIGNQGWKKHIQHPTKGECGIVSVFVVLFCFFKWSKYFYTTLPVEKQRQRAEHMTIYFYFVSIFTKTILVFLLCH